MNLLACAAKLAARRSLSKANVIAYVNTQNPAASWVRPSESEEGQLAVIDLLSTQGNNRVCLRRQRWGNRAQRPAIRAIWRAETIPRVIWPCLGLRQHLEAQHLSRGGP